MLELRPNCECCDRDLPPESSEARICTNCGGDLVARPIRPAAMLAKYPASTKRVLKAEGCVPKAA